jgi:alkylated DNA repair dioxygenase AlkB
MFHSTPGHVQPQPIDVDDGKLTLYSDWLRESDAENCFKVLEDELAWEQSIIRIMGREVKIPRKNAWYGDPGARYTYSGTAFDPIGWTATLERLRGRLEATLGVGFNSVLANLYRDGNDSMGWHSDDEPELGENPLIASVSLGGVRKFSLKHKSRKDLDPIYLWLPSGSLLVMSGRTQRFWRHQVPKTKKPVAPRINLTFRQILI